MAVTAAPLRRVNPLADLRTHLHGLEYHWQALIVAVFGTFMVMLDTTVVNIALPQMINVFQTNVATAQLVLTGYTLALAIIMPAAGYLTDTFGIKRVFMLSLLGFTMGSMLCGLSWNIQSLIFFRILQGLGGGLIGPLGTTILFTATPPRIRGTVNSIYGLPIMIAPVLGPTLGGYIVQYVDWRVIFTMNIPIGIVAIFMAFTLLRDTPKRPNMLFDAFGFVLSAGGFAAILYGLTYASTDGWGAPNIVALVGGGAASLVVFVIVELTQSQPLLDLRVFKIRAFSLSTMLSFVITTGAFSSVFLLPLFLQNLRGLGAMESGLLTFPQSLGAMFVMPLAGRLFDRVGPRPLMYVGLTIMAFATYQLSHLSLTFPNNELRGILILRGMGLGLTMMPAMTVSMNSLPMNLIARGSALTNVLRQLFSSFGTAMFASILVNRITFHKEMLTQVMTPDLSAVRTVVAGIESMVVQNGGTLAQGQMEAMMALYKNVVVQASVMAYDDCFLLGAILIIFALIPATMLNTTGLARTPRPGGGPSSMAD